MSSQSGTLPGQPAIGVLLAFNPYSFLWACEIEIPGSIGGTNPMISFLPLSPDADSSEMLLLNGDNVAQLYAAEWRHINP